MALTAKERKKYILNLDKVVRRWRFKSKIFCGGCCFAAGQIAKMLEKHGIRYQVVCWDEGRNKSTDLENIITSNNCYHIAIQVSLDSKRFIIGGDIDNSFRNVITYNRMSSKRLIDCDLLGVKYDTWNYVYNRKLNNRFINILNKSVEK